MTYDYTLLGLPAGQWIVTLVAAALAALIVAIGWYITNYQTSQRDNRNREQGMMTGFLAEAYEALASAANRPSLTPEQVNAFETSIARIQLFGSSREVEAVRALLDEWQRPQPDGRPRANLVRTIAGR